jgi:hypothetical protein
MSWRHIFRKSDQDQETPGTTPDPPGLGGPRVTPPDAVPPPGERVLPPHMQKILGERKRPPAPPLDDRAKLARLERNRLAAIFDVEQGELAASPDNPWRDRIGFLTEAMKTVDEDRKAVQQVTPAPWFPVPPTPITGIVVETEPVASVAFSVGGNQFAYAEERDWAERGHSVTIGELRLQEGRVDDLLPEAVPADLRESLRNHLDESLFVFASDMRDRTIDQVALPEQPTLFDLAKPCPVCGGWLDWMGRCQVCRKRDVALQELKREENRLLSERSREAEERHRLEERLPVARRRLKDIETEIAALQARM